ncbi:Surfactin synthase thioesterase subunit [Streptomyces sp. 2323.1]|uniref:thioesterase II family protein n=1 Tax=Streptomyces sp. 2323.1 TaxID=1938841 RepID=UPI000BB7648D|nr:alpha/beta fold hydrolase [Streptomyces sp. 2323.1]SOE09139.1 Surfactin synthase thioesterase subunit [Streptomyces sp. 2323.1]
MSSPLADDGLWCRRFHPAPDAGRRLVCFPHAGGSASFYHPVSAALSPRVDVLAVQYPGRQDRRQEPALDDIGLLADRIAEALGAWTDRPLTFFGHSMGALVAFEVARRLERDGDGPVRLFASGRRAPSAYRDEQVHRRDDDGIVAELRALSGTDARVLDDEEMLRMVLPALRSDYKAVETYRSEPGAVVRCPVTVLVGDDDPKTSLDEARSWDAHTTDACDLRVFPGGHFYLADRPTEVMDVLSEHFTSAALPHHA